MNPVLKFVSGVLGKYVVGALIGGTVAYFIGRYRRRRELKKLESGTWDTTVDFIKVHLEDKKEGGVRLHASTIISVPLHSFFGNRAAEHMLVRSARDTDKVHSVVPMPGQLGSYVLRELHGMFRHSQVEGDAPEEHWILAPVYQTYHGIGIYTPAAVLVRPRDLARFTTFAECKDFDVLFSDRGALILTLLELRSKWAEERAEFLRLKEAGRSTTYHESMWTIRARLNTAPYEPAPEEVAQGIVRGWKKVSWEKYAKDLELLGYQS